MSAPANRILVAHGTRKSSGVALIGDIADRVAATLGSPVGVAFVDVLGRPRPTYCPRYPIARPSWYPRSCPGATTCAAISRRMWRPAATRM